MRGSIGAGIYQCGDLLVWGSIGAGIYWCRELSGCTRIDRETADVHLRDNRADLVTLPDEDSELIEVFITYTEALAALRKMNNNNNKSWFGWIFS